MKYIITVIFLMQALCFAVHAKIPLQKAIENGIKLSYELKNQSLEESSIHQKKILNQKRRFLSIDFGSSYLYQSEKMNIQFQGIPIAPGMSFPGFSKEVGAYHNYDVKLSVSQPLYTGGVLSNAVKSEELREAAEKSKTRLKYIECEGKIKTSYFTYHVYLQKKKSLSTLLDNLSLHLQKIEDLFAENLVKKSDVLETKEKMEEIRIQLMDLEQLIQTESIQFHSLCGYNSDEIDDSFREKITSLDDAKYYFKLNHPMLKALDLQTNIMNAQRSMVRGKYLPQVVSFAEAHYGKPGIDYFSNEWGHYFRGGVNISLPLFQWNKRKQELAIPAIAIQKIENEKANFIKEIIKSLDQFYASKEILERKLTHLEKALSYADEDADLKEQLYQENQISHIDYLSALTVKERYQSMLHEVNFQLQLLNVSINTLIGYQE